MNQFRFRAFAAHSGEPMSVEIFMQDGTNGFTPRQPGQAFVVTSPSEAPQFWYAMVWGKRIAFGQSSGGEVVLSVSPEGTEVYEPDEQPVALAS